MPRNKFDSLNVAPEDVRLEAEVTAYLDHLMPPQLTVGETVFDVSGLYVVSNPVLDNPISVELQNLTADIPFVAYNVIKLFVGNHVVELDDILDLAQGKTESKVLNRKSLINLLFCYVKVMRLLGSKLSVRDIFSSLKIREFWSPKQDLEQYKKLGSERWRILVVSVGSEAIYYTYLSEDQCKTEDEKTTLRDQLKSIDQTQDITMYDLVFKDGNRVDLPVNSINRELARQADPNFYDWTLKFGQSRH